jgi:LysM repeat protein
MLNCAPSKNIRQRNSDKYKNSSSDDSFFNWPAGKKENNYEDSTTSDNDTDNSDNAYKEKSQIKSGSYLLSYNNSQNINPDNKTARKKNYYPDKTQNNNEYLPQNNKNKINYNDSFKFKTYKVEKGDNLTRISKKVNISTSELAGINNLDKDCKIKEGMILKIPSCNIDNKTNTEFTSQKNKQNKPNFTWPIKNVYNTKRDGLDGVKPIGIIITGEAGSAVFPSAEGIVTKVGNMRGFGNYIILKHMNQYLSIYSNLKDIKVNEGEKVKCGKSIGRLEGNKLHFQIDYSGKPQNPMVYLSGKS